jgi:hypothetical protein
MVEDTFDPSIYTRAPKLDVAGGVALSIQLLATVPAKPTPAVKKAAQKLRKNTIKLQEAWKERDRIEKPADPRPVDVMADAAMGRLVSRLEGYAGLSAEQYPLATRAGEILAALFPDLEFLQYDYNSQWAETQKRIERIDEEDFAKDIDRISGPEFLAEVRRIHALYGVVIGVTQAREKVAAPSLAAPLRDVSASIAAYAIQLSAVYMDADTDDSTRRVVRAALAPMDEYRNGAARRGAKRATDATPEVTPETSVPEIPDAPR